MLSNVLFALALLLISFYFGLKVKERNVRHRRNRKNEFRMEQGTYAPDQAEDARFLAWYKRTYPREHLLRF